MIKVKCAHCGRIYEAPTKRSVYCSDGCRLKAYRERTSKNKSHAIQAGRETKKKPGSVSADKSADKMIRAMRRHGKFSPEWWTEYAAYMTERGIDAKVNDISVYDPDFVEIMMLKPDKYFFLK